MFLFVQRRGLDRSSLSAISFLMIIDWTRREFTIQSKFCWGYENHTQGRKKVSRLVGVVVGERRTLNQEWVSSGIPPRPLARVGKVNRLAQYNSGGRKPCIPDLSLASLIATAQPQAGKVCSASFELNVDELVFQPTSSPIRRPYFGISG